MNIVYPAHPFRIKKDPQDKEFIFDELRKLWVRLTPEEWVRQNFIQYLLIEKKYPAALIAVEKEIKLNDLRKRCDILVYNKDAAPWLLVECKKMEESLDEKVASQVLSYNAALPVIFLIVTNGRSTYGFEIKENVFVRIDELPSYSS